MNPLDHGLFWLLALCALVLLYAYVVYLSLPNPGG